MAEKDQKKELGIKVLYTWQAPERMWYPKSQLWYLSYGALFLILILIAAKMGYFIVIVGLIALLLLWFIQGTIAPLVLEHHITTKGFFTSNTLFRWEDIEYFWFAHKQDALVLHLDFKIQTNIGRITLITIPQDEDKLFRLLSERIEYGLPHQIGYNFISRILYGEYIPIVTYIEDLDKFPGEINENNKEKTDKKKSSKQIPVQKSPKKI